ncbi:MAG: GntR family transcriptional regulator [Clostridiales bacterium]|nr:GntR family transcriptional regulator [Clostridiales bacterium]
MKTHPMPRYLRIAIDIAESIISGELPVNSKISGRSTLAGKYNVSPETIRKSISLLKDNEVVTSSQKSGITILNVNNANLFINQMQSTEKSNDLKTNIIELLNKKQKIDLELKGNIERLIEISSRPKNISTFYPYELQVPADSHLVNHSIADMSFWHHTGATIIMLKRLDKTILSPGPNVKFKADDTIVFVCKTEHYDQTHMFITLKE